MAQRKIKINQNGEVEIQHFDSGGAVAQTPGGAPSSSATGAATGGAAVTNNIGQLPGAGVDPYTAALAKPAGEAVNAAGGITQGIAGALTAQNNYNAQLAPTDQTDYSGVIGQSSSNALSGYDQYQQNQQQQSQLAQALQNQASILQNEQAGGGPNPAQAALAQNTGANISSQAALMAGQRGASSNVGLEAREAAQQGAATQQAAVGQGATLEAQQQLAAGQQLQTQEQAQASLAGQEGNQIIGEQGANNQLFGTAAAAQNAQNNTNVNNYAMAQGINAQVAQGNANADNKTTAGIMNSGSSLLSSLAKGGEVGKDGKNPKLAKVLAKDRLKLPEHIKGMATIYHPKFRLADGGQIPDEPNAGAIQDPRLADGQGAFSSDSSSGGGKSGGGGGALGLLALLKSGGKVPGKAAVKGNSSKNDTVPAMLSAGEIVLPRSVTQSDDPVGNAAKFVAALIKKHGSMPGNEDGDFKSALKKAIGSRRK